MRHRLSGALGVCLFLLTSCSDGPDGQSREQDAVVVPVDDVVDVRPGGTASLPEEFVGNAREIAAAQHLFGVLGPDGPVNVFEVTLAIAPGNTKPQRCLVIAGRNEASWACGDEDQPLGGPRDDNLLAGGSGTDESPGETIFQFAGPPETTHFIVTVNSRRTRIAAVQGIAVWVLRGRMCQVLPTAVEAWADNKLLERDDQRDWCE